MLAPADTLDAPHDGQRRGTAPTTYILHPITHEVYRVPQRALLHDAKNPVYMEYDVFEQMGATGQLSGERLLHHDRAQACSFNASQVLAVRLKQHGASKGGPPLHAWASRMVTALPEDVFPDVAMALVGHEFLWLWPPPKAHNAYHTRRDKRRLNPDQVMLPIDEIEPTCRYTQSVPGAMLGPDDIDGSERVPYHELTAVQRFFCMCIKPQQTLFPRRPTADRWTQRVSAIIDQSQEAARQGGKWTLHNSVQRMRKRANEEFDRLVTTTTSKRRREYECERTVLVHGRGSKRAHAGTTDDEADSSDISDIDELLITKQPYMRRVHEEHRARLWAQLPSDILVRILCTRLGDGLTSPNVDDARRCIFALRSVSRGTRALVDSYVGVQIASLATATVACVVWPPSHSGNDSLVAVAARVRALGLGMTDVAQLVRHEIQLDHVEGWTLPKTPAVVPDWRWYLELRREARGRHGSKTTVQRVPGGGLPSADLGELMTRHRHDEPHIWGSRFAGADFGFTTDYDAMVSAAGECDIRDQMHTLAGVGS